MMSLYEDIIQCMTVASDGANIALESARAEDWKISVRAAPHHDIMTHQMWLCDHTKPTPLTEAERMRLQAIGGRDLTWP